MTIPYVSTRGYYDLSSGKTIKKKKYHFSSKHFQKLEEKKEVIIVIHGLRNDRKSALKKFILAKNRLKKIGYVYPVVGFSYDSNTKGAHLKKCVKNSLKAGQIIAKKNGKNLAQFIIDFKQKNPHTKIRLIGHSLGTEVILSTLQYLSQKSNSKKILEQVYFFGSSINKDVFTSNKNIKNSCLVIRKGIINYYAPNDEVLAESQSANLLNSPIGLCLLKSTRMNNFIQRKVFPENHRFASYLKTITKFP